MRVSFYHAHSRLDVLRSDATNTDDRRFSGLVRFACAHRNLSLVARNQTGIADSAATTARELVKQNRPEYIFASFSHPRKVIDAPRSGRRRAVAM
jgi:hypothetical protein